MSDTNKSKKELPKPGTSTKQIMRSVIEEFVESGDIEEAMEDIKKNVQIEGPEFVKEAVIFGMERHAYERELVSKLLAQVYNIFLSHDLQNGFQRLLDRLPDLIIDVPSAREFLAKFIARAVHDEIVVPAFFREALINNKEASHVISLAYETLNAPDEKKRMDKIWGAGSLVSVRKLRKEVKQIFLEYLEHQDPAISVASINDLNVPHFNVEMVKSCIELSLEQNSVGYVARPPGATKDKGKLLHLIGVFEQSAILTTNDIQQAFTLVTAQLPQLSLDIPHAKEILGELLAEAKAVKILPQ